MLSFLMYFNAVAIAVAFFVGALLKWGKMFQDRRKDKSQEK